MNRIFSSLFLLALSFQGMTQKQDHYDKLSSEWLEKYYPNDTVIKNKLIAYYDHLENPLNEQSIENLFHEQQNIAGLLTHNVDLGDEDDFLAYDQRMNDAIMILQDLELPGFLFSCAAECTMFDVSVDYLGLIDAAIKTSSIHDDIALEIISDTWGIQRVESPSFQNVDCCSCSGENALGTGEQYDLLNRINKLKSSSNLFVSELEEIKNTIKRYILWNDGFSMDDVSVIHEFNLVKPLLNFTEKELKELKQKDLFKNHILNYSVVNGKVLFNQKEIPPACIAQLKTELNGDNSQAAIYLERNSSRACVDSKLPLPVGVSEDITYVINEDLGNDRYKLTVKEYIDGSTGGYSDHIIVQFTNKPYILKDGSTIYVLVLEKKGDWQ